MKKQLILGGLAAAACIAYASSEKINLIKNGSVFESFRVEKIDHIGYSGDSEGYNTIDIYTLDGKKASVSLDGIDHIEYVAPLPSNPLSLEVEPHHYCATLTVNATDENAWYRIAGVDSKSLKNYDEADWADIVVESDIEYIYSVAAEYGRPLSSFRMDEIFEKGSQTRDWYPSESTLPETHIVLVAYTARLDGDKVVVTTEPLRADFTTKKIEDLGVKFDVTAEMTSNTIKVIADAQGGSDIPFAIELYSAEEIAVSGLKSLVQNSLLQMQQLVYNYGFTWDEVTFRTHGEKTWTNRRMGDQWFAVVFGCEYGIATTDASWEVFTIPAPEITDPCTFEATATQLSPSEMNVTIVPSSPDTRYAAFLVEAEKITETMTVEQYVANQIYWINSMNTFQWDTTDFIHTGEATLNTHDDLIGGEYLKADKEYYAIVCGIDETGTRTTEVKTVSCMTTTQTTEGMTFDVKFGAFDDNSTWSHFLEVTVTPSDPSAKYVFQSLSASNAYADLNCTDEEFISRYVDVQGQYLELLTGEKTKKLAFSSEFDYTTYEYVFKPYILMIFGYDGAQTSPLYIYSIDTATGKAELIRGPKDEALSFSINPGAFDDNSTWSHFLEVTVTPSDPSAKYVFQSLSASNAYADLNCTDEEFISRYVDVQGQYLELLTGEKTKKLAFSSEFDYTTYEYVFKPYILMIFGYDGAQTSPLYLYSIDTATGTLTQLRGPGME